jgi:hypothetical protein
VEADVNAAAVERVAFPFSDLSAHGMLWLINKAVLHPRGLALGLVYVDGSDEPVGWAVSASTSGEPYTYDKGVDEQDLFRKVNALLETAHDVGRVPTRSGDTIAPATKGVYSDGAETEQPQTTGASTDA